MLSPTLENKFVVAENRRKIISKLQVIADYNKNMGVDFSYEEMKLYEFARYQ